MVFASTPPTCLRIATFPVAHAHLARSRIAHHAHLALSRMTHPPTHPRSPGYLAYDPPTYPSTLASARYSKRIYLLYAQFEEAHGLARHAMGVYERACKAVPKAERNGLWELYIERAAATFGVTYTRELYGQAIEVLPDREAGDSDVTTSQRDDGTRELTVCLFLHALCRSKSAALRMLCRIKSTALRVLCCP
jgi:hypothetical protein